MPIAKLVILSSCQLRHGSFRRLLKHQLSSEY